MHFYFSWNLHNFFIASKFNDELAIVMKQEVNRHKMNKYFRYHFYCNIKLIFQNLESNNFFPFIILTFKKVTLNFVSDILFITNIKINRNV